MLLQYWYNTLMLIDLAFVVVVVLIVGYIVREKFFKVREKVKTGDEVDKKEERQEKQEKRRQWNREPEQQQLEEPEQGSDGEEEGGVENDPKRLEKMRKNREKKERQEAMMQMYKEKDAKNQKYRDAQEEKQRLQEQKRLKEEQTLKQLQEQEAKRKEQQFNKWKDLITVENTGTEKKSKEEQQAERKQFQDRFLKYIKDNKICPLQDMSNEFKIPTKKVVDTIKEMEEKKLINGVFDERGKYIDVSENEWNAIMSYMRAKGRVSKSDMMLECANIIRLEGLRKGNQELTNLIDNIDEKEVVGA